MMNNLQADSFPRPPSDAQTFAQLFRSIVQSVGTAIHGKDETIGYALTCLLAEGHLLIEDIPGVGKTSLAKALTRALDLSYGRIQFTPDLLPADVVGSSVWNAHDGSIEFIPGPVFSNLLLGDEINRASPKTQSALLEAMAEGHVTVDGTTRDLPSPFMVIATQNPLEHHGTFPLPESQLDRFTMRLSVGYPDPRHELELLTEVDHDHSLDRVPRISSASQIESMVAAALKVHVAQSVAQYVVSLATASRGSSDITLGISPRASLGLLRTARVWAASQDRDFVTPDDIKSLAVAVLAHRIVLDQRASARGQTATATIEALLDQTSVPTV